MVTVKSLSPSMVLTPSMDISFFSSTFTLLTSIPKESIK